MSDIRKVVIFDLDDTLFDTTGQLDPTYKNIENVTLFPGVDDGLKILRQKFVIYLTTAGSQEIQNKKIKVLGVRKYFDEVFVVESKEEKLVNFELIKSRHDSLEAGDIIVVGDRLDSEIMFGNMLGFKTIRVKQGRRKDEGPKFENETPTLELASVREVFGYLLEQ
jgi:FMN phosphatase YigB (HAD superfamily)